MTEEVQNEAAAESLLSGVEAPAEEPTETPEGENPEWFLADKYNSIEDQAKAYPELASKFGGFTGAPDEYELTLAEGIEYDIADDDPLLADFKEMAKAQNMSQDAFNKFANIYIEQQIAHEKLTEEAASTHVAEQMKALGDKGEARLQNVAQWAKAQLGDEGLYAKFADGLQSAGMVEVFEALMSATGNAPQNTHRQTPAAPAVTVEELHALQFEKDEFGNRKMSVDPEHRAKVEELHKQLYGDKHTTQVMG